MTDQIDDLDLYLDLLLAAKTRRKLKLVWLTLPEDHRRALRPSERLAEHAWTVLKTSTR